MALYGGCASSDGVFERVGFAIFRSRILVGLVARVSFEISDMPGGCGMLNKAPNSVAALFSVALNMG